MTNTVRELPSQELKRNYRAGRFVPRNGCPDVAPVTGVRQSDVKVVCHSSEYYSRVHATLLSLPGHGMARGCLGRSESLSERSTWGKDLCRRWTGRESTVWWFLHILSTVPTNIRLCGYNNYYWLNYYCDNVS